MFHTIVQFIPAFFISAILKVINKTKNSPKGAELQFRFRSVLLSTGLLLILALKTILENHYSYDITGIGGGMRRAVSLAIYEKLLKLKTYNSESVTSGKLINLLTLDAQRIEKLGVAMHLLWDGGLQAVGYTLILMWLLGPVVLVSIAVFLGSTWANMYFINRYVINSTNMVVFLV